MESKTSDVLRKHTKNDIVGIKDCKKIGPHGPELIWHFGTEHTT